MYEIFREHPDIFVPKIKDIYFFDRFYDNGIDWYLNFFNAHTTEKAVGEICHDYLYSREVARRINKHLPDVKLIVCLRERLDFTKSMYLYDKSIFQYFTRKQYASEIDFYQFACHPKIISLSDYNKNLSPYLEIFEKNKMLIKYYDELKMDPIAFAKDIFNFLGVTQSFKPPSLYRFINVAREPRNQFFADLVYKIGQIIRKSGHPEILGKTKRNYLFEKIIYRPINKIDLLNRLSSEQINTLNNIYTAGYHELPGLTGKPLPRNWSKV